MWGWGNTCLTPHVSLRGGPSIPQEPVAFLLSFICLPENVEVGGWEGKGATRGGQETQPMAEETPVLGSALFSLGGACCQVGCILPICAFSFPVKALEGGCLHILGWGRLSSEGPVTEYSCGCMLSPSSRSASGFGSIWLLICWWISLLCAGHCSW